MDWKPLLLILLLLIFLYVVFGGKRKECPKCLGLMRTYGQIGDGSGPDYDHQMWKCSCGHTESELVEG